MKKSLNFKINALTVTLVIVFFSLFGIFDYMQKRKTRTEELYSGLSIAANRLARTLKNPVWDLDTANMANPVIAEMQNRNIHTIAVYDSRGKNLLVGKTRDDAWEVIDLTHRLSDEQIQETQTVTYENRAIAYVKVQATDRFIKEEISSAAFAQIKRTILLILVFIVVLTAGMYIAVLKPVKELADSVRAITEGSIHEPVEASRDDELGDLAKDFEIMRHTIKEKIDNLSKEIAERKKIEKALKAGEENLRITLDSIGDAVIAADIAGNITRMNPVAEKLTGWAVKDALGKPLARVFHIIDTRTNEPAVNPATQVLENGEIVDLSAHTMLIAGDGSRYRIADSAAPIRDAEGVVTGVVMVFRDVTEDYRVQEELRRLRNYLSNIIDSMPSVLVGVDMEGRVIQWNRRAEQVTGLAADVARGKMLPDLFPGMAGEMEKIFESIRTREIRHERKRPRLLENTTCYEDVTIYPLVESGVEGAVIRIDDVTEKVRMEEMMIQNEKMLSVGGLAAGMAHEINNPLAGMMQSAGVMEIRLCNKTEIPANLKAAEAAGTSMEAIRSYMEARSIPRMLRNIHESGRRVAAIVDNMLSFAGRSEARRSSHALDGLFDRTLELAATDYDLESHYDFKMIEIRKEYEENLPPVPCEGAKIQQVLLNILRNGAQAMHEAGTGNPLFIVRTRLEKERKMVCMEIEDNGPGMDEAVRKRVFEPFFTTKPVGEGTGLGLSVSYFIVTENHGGEMDVESLPGFGAKFIICLPQEGEKTGANS